MERGQVTGTPTRSFVILVLRPPCFLFGRAHVCVVPPSSLHGKKTVNREIKVPTTMSEIRLTFSR